MKKIVKIVALLLAFALIYAVVDRVMSVKSDDGINVIQKTLIISKKPVTTGKSRDKATEFTTKLLLLE